MANVLHLVRSAWSLLLFTPQNLSNVITLVNMFLHHSKSMWKPLTEKFYPARRIQMILLQLALVLCEG